MRTQFSTPILIGEDGASPLERLPLMGNDESVYDEDWLQDLLFNHPQMLPVNEIDQSFLNLVPACRELNTRAGPVDVLYVTPEGKLVIAEAKLWRNPEARRKVIGQILDYAKEVGRWSYEDLQREVTLAVKRQGGNSSKLFDIVASKHSDLSESEFVDSVSRNLKRGEFLLLIVGDGIREGVAAIAEFLENNGTLHFTFGLVELAIYKMNNKARLVQPRVIAQTTIIKRTVITLEADGLVCKDAEEPGETLELNDSQKFYADFWSEFLAQLRLDDSSQPLPNVTRLGSIYLRMPAKSNAWITVYFSQKEKGVGVFLTFNLGSLGNAIYSQLVEDKLEIEKELGVSVRWESTNGKHTIGVSKQIPDLRSLQYRQEIKEFLSDYSNRFVNVFRPRISRIIEDM